MNIPSDYRILVVDAPTTRACNLREALLRAGAKVHVASSPGSALMLINRLHFHTAFVAYDMCSIKLNEFCDALAERNISYILTGSCVDPPSKHPAAMELAA
jgi:PleD family two-component response regulator